MQWRAGIAGCLLAALLGSCAELPRVTEVGSLSYAEQGWSEGQRRWFYHASQGTKIMPYAWFMALEQPQISVPPLSAPPFTAPGYLARFGFLTDAVSPENPDGLPVGFARGSGLAAGVDKAEPVVGLTCAACHTGQVEYRGRGVRVDGGPAMIDVAGFQAKLGVALLLTDQSGPRFARFADRVLGPLAGQPERDALKQQLDQSLADGLAEQKLTAALYPVTEGPGRLDAIGRGENFVFGTLMDDHRNFAVADAPVSYPALWGATWFDWVQYSGSVRQPMGRNLAEAIGVRSMTTLTGKPEDRYRSTVDVRSIVAMETLISGATPDGGLRAPGWPEALLGAIDREKAARGRVHFTRLCAGCHEGGWTAADGYGRRYRQVKLVGLGEIGTDPKAAANLAARRAYLSPEATRVSLGVDGLRLVTDAVFKRWFDENGVPAAERLSMSGFRTNEWRAPLAYKARPLEGIWATGPYLHNGSVPTLYELLLPAARRSAVFYTGSREFDPVQVGFERTAFPGAFRLDTSVPGNSNLGHEFRDGTRGAGVIGPALSDDQRWEIIEFLKTL